MRATTELKQQVVIAACGNLLAGDDQAGPVIAQQLRLQNRPDWKIIDVADFIELLEFEEATSVVVIDAVRTESPPGTVHLVPVDVGTPQLEELHSWSTHKCELWEALALGKAVGRTLPQITLIGIECESVERGADMTPAVSHACEFVADNFEALLRFRLPYCG